MVSTGDVNEHPQWALIVKSVNQFLKASAPDRETEPFRTKNKAWSVNNKKHIRNQYAGTNGDLDIPKIHA